MNWTISLMYAVLLTSFTGTVLFGVWYGIGRFLEYIGYINVIYELLKTVLVFWFAPLSFFILRYINSRYIYWGGFILLSTPFLRVFSVIFCVVWLVGVLFFLIRFGMEIRQVRRLYKKSVPCEGAEYDYFENICKELGIKSKRVELVQNYHEKVPRVFGIIKPTVVLPVREYSEEELRVIFVHELTHYKQKDLWLKSLTELALAFHFFNPFMWLFSRKVQFWSEYACDYASIPIIGNLKSYFEVITAMAVDSVEKEALNSYLVEKKNDLVDRMLRMKRSYNMKNKSKMKAALLVAAMFLVSTSGVSAATVAAGEGYVNAYEATVEEFREEPSEISPDEDIEYITFTLEDGVIEDVGEIYNNVARSNTGFAWTIRGGSSRRSPFFSATSDGVISINVIAESSGIDFRAGIIQPDSSRRYCVSSNGAIAHTFLLTQDGEYCIYVQNMEDYSINVEGSYLVRE